MNTAADVQWLVRPPLATANLPGVGGSFPARPEDFVVEEIPAYAADGREERHLLLRLRKRELSTDEALRLLARHLDVPRGSLGVAGLKDKDAVTNQFVSVPWDARSRLTSFAHDRIELGPAQPHGQKLRRGHLRGNRFAVVLRELDTSRDEACRRIAGKLDRIRSDGGLWNLFGRQRFGGGGGTARRGLQRIAEGTAGRRDQFLLSVAQAALFNFYLRERLAGAGLGHVLDGDVLGKVDTGGLFDCTQPDVDQERLQAGEIFVTGPIYGSKTRRPRDNSPAGESEDEVLRQAGVDPVSLTRLGRNAPGSRRRLQVSVDAFSVEPWPAEPASGLGEGVRLRFCLPPGSYATRLLAEVQGGARDGAMDVPNTATAEEP